MHVAYIRPAITYVRKRIQGAESRDRKAASADAWRNFLTPHGVGVRNLGPASTVLGVATDIH